jgi:Flp pilus assembly pilin Flp
MNGPMLMAFVKLNLRLRRLGTDETGQGLSEYALLLTGIAIVAIAAIAFTGGRLTTVLSSIARSV